MAGKIVLGGGDEAPKKKKLILKRSSSTSVSEPAAPTGGKKLLLKKSGASTAADRPATAKVVLRKTGAHSPAETKPVLKLKTSRDTPAGTGAHKLTLKSGGPATTAQPAASAAGATDRILLVDDEASILKVLTHILGKMGFNTVACGTGEEALELLQQQPFDLLITDLNLGDGMSGLDLLHEAREANSLMPVIMITAFATVNVAVQALKEGAFDLITKPFKMEQLTETVHNAINYGGMYNIESMVKQEMKLHFGTIVGEDPKMTKIYDAIRRLSKIDISVHIQGEQGTGRLTIARVLHYCSKRAGQSFYMYDCNDKSQEELEQDLFGVDGIEDGLLVTAEGGTVYLKDIHVLSERLQTKLLNVFANKQIVPMGSNDPVDVNVRLICSTTVALKVLVESGDLLKDLYYRLSAFSIEIPPLRYHVEDIPLLVNYFCYQESMDNEGEDYSVSNSAMNKLLNYSWPDNVRELRAAISHAVQNSDSHVIKLPALPEAIIEHSVEPGAKKAANGVVGRSLRNFLKNEVESRQQGTLQVQDDELS